jgi:hypothetical protein
MSFAKLDSAQIDRLRSLEEELGTGLIAVEPKCHWTDLDDEHVQKLRDAEDELGVVLLAYESE